jgi:peroxiredoxin
VQGLESIYPQVRALGGEIVLIGPETDANARKLMEKTRATIPVLHDTDGAVADAYRLLFDLPADLQEMYQFLQDANPALGVRLPIPATFVVGSDGTVIARYVNADYRHRMEPRDVLAAVRNAAGA